MATASDVGENLGRTLTSAEQTQVNRWIEATLTIIRARLGALNLLDPEILDLVVVEAVSLRLRNPDAASQREVAIDDGKVSTRWEKASGQITILDEWWDWLTPAVQDRGAFTVRPSFVPDCRAW